MSPPESTHPEFVVAAVAALARDLEQQRRRLNGLTDLPEQMADLAALVASLAERVTPPAAHFAGPVSWLAFPDLTANPAAPEVAAGHLSDLTEWMDSVYLRYPDAAAALPDCWLWHPDVVEELTWLRQAWTAAYARSVTSVALAGDWHDRQRPGVVRRVKAAAGTCSTESHAPGGERDRGPHRSPFPGESRRIAQWWTADRNGSPPHPNSMSAGRQA